MVASAQMKSPGSRKSSFKLVETFEVRNKDIEENERSRSIEASPLRKRYACDEFQER